MVLRNTTARWGALSQAFHWVIVALVITQVVLASTANYLPRGAEKVTTLTYHMWVGITILMLVALRLAWRWMSPAPPLPSTMRPYECRLAHFTAQLVYVVLLAMPLSGWAMASARAFPVSWFGLVQLPDFVPTSRPLHELMHVTHEAFAYTLGLVAVLHIAGALWHHFVLRDGVLRRMLPFA